MPRITFVSAGGEEVMVDASDGDSVMQVALAGNVDGIIAECGGSMMCATCHVYVAEDWSQKVGAASNDERAMLDFAASEVKETSRLSCQIKITDDLDGLMVHLPEAQI
jgi:2Fe-2S ferredoxin